MHLWLLMEEELLRSSTIQIYIGWPADTCRLRGECQQHIALQVHTVSLRC